MQRKDDYVRVARGWVTADGTVIAPDQNLGLMLAEAGVWAQGSTQPADERADGNRSRSIVDARHGRGTDLTNGVAIDTDNQMPAPTLTLAPTVRARSVLAKYQLPKERHKGHGCKTAYAEIKVALTADHQAR